MAQFGKYTIVYRLNGKQTTITVDDIRYNKQKDLSDSYLFAHTDATGTFPEATYYIPVWDIEVIYKKCHDDGGRIKFEVVYNLREVTAKAISRLSKKENDIIKRD